MSILRLVLLPFLAAPALAQSLYVDAAAAPGGDGTSWVRAYRDLGAALARAQAGERVWVAEGTYHGGFTVPAGVTLSGGFRAGATRLDQARWLEQPTVLDGQQQMRVLQLGDGSLIEGLHVRNGKAFNPGGAGVLIDGVDPIVRNCWFTGHQITGGTGTAMNVINRANPRVSNCLFTKNLPSAHTIDVSCLAAGTFEYLVVYDNPENGIHLSRGASSVIRNCVIGKNGGRGVCDIQSVVANQPVLDNNLFFQNTISHVHYLGSELTTITAVNALPYASNNIEAAPQFVDEVNGDYRLTATSAAIDAGRGNPGVAKDAFGYPRAIDGDLDGTLATDIGAHEFSQIDLGVAGAPLPGGSLTITMSGVSSAPAVLVLSPVSTPGVALGATGVFYLAPPFVAVGPVALPSSSVVAIPPGATGDVALQAAVAIGRSARLSNFVGLRIQ